MCGGRFKKRQERQEKLGGSLSSVNNHREMCPKDCQARNAACWNKEGSFGAGEKEVISPYASTLRGARALGAPPPHGIAAGRMLRT